MGRRALRKIDPGLDLSWHLLEAENLPLDCGAQWFFGPGVPLELEVGSGKGLFLSTSAAARPEIGFIGIEISGKYARFAAARLARAGRRNARVIHGDAQLILAQHVPADSLQAVHVYFPDPWWKKRHHKRRIMNPSFIGQVQRVLRAAGELHFWTDVSEYFDQSLQMIGETSSLSGPFPVPQRPAEDDLDYQTHFERRTRLGNRPVYRAVFRKP